MIRAGKVRAIAAFEFVSTVTRKGYLISTFGMPLFILAYAGIIAVPAHFVAQKEAEVKLYGVVDHPGILEMTGDVEVEKIPPEVRRALELSGQSQAVVAFLGNNVFRPFDDRDVAIAALQAEEIKAVYEIDPGYLDNGKVEIYFREGLNFDFDDAERSLGRMLQARILEGKMSEELAQRVRRPISESKEWTISPTGEIEEHHKFAMVARLVIPLGFTFLLFMSLMMSAGYLLQGTAVEKENKVVEVLLSSADPDEVLAGKLVGLGGAGLLQILVWFGMVLVAGGMFATALATFGVEVPWGAVAAALPFFLAAYLFLGSLMLGTGSLGNNMRESQQYSMVWSLLAVVPMMFMALFITDPHHMVAKVMTWIPFTAPVTVILRMTLAPEGIAWWEVVGSLAMMTLCTWLALRFGARLFRVGLLLTGARPKFREILRQARLG